jgi:ATPase subunit of ABC transporter with duplicated ATPase domains
MAQPLPDKFIMSMNRVSKVVPPKRTILKDISLSFFPGAKIGVLGLNGSGKSTLLRIMAGVDKEANMLFGDFGAASNLNVLTERQQKAMQAIEVRAFGCLLDDLLPLSHHAQKTHHYDQLINIKNNCMQETSFNRPTFSTIVEQLELIE